VWGFVDDGVEAQFESDLRADLRTLPEFKGSLRLVIGRDQSQSVSRAGVNP